MNVLILSSIFPPHIFGGGEVAVYNLAKLLVSRGHTVHVATSLERGDEAAWGWLMPEGWRLYRLPIPRRYTLFDRQGATKAQKLLLHVQDYFDPRNVALIERLMADIEVDHVSIHNVVGMGFNGLRCLNEADATVAYFLHDAALSCFSSSAFRDGVRCEAQCLGCRASSLLRQNNVAKIDRLGFISPSQANLKQVQRFAPIVERRPTLVLHNVQDDLPASLPSWAPDRALRLVYVGRLHATKGAGFLLDVVDQVALDHPVHLTILGTGPEETALRQNHDGKPWVTFRGFVARDEVARIVGVSDLYCMPSLWAEPYGLTTAQALRLGTPVLGSATGGTVELVRDGVTGLLLQPGNHDDWYHAIAALCSDRARLQKLREATSALRGEFESRTIGDAYEDFVVRLRAPVS